MTYRVGVAVEEEIKALRADVGDLRRDLNVGLRRVSDGLERLIEKIDDVAAVRPRLIDLERRVARLEARNGGEP